jgi:hypothetical protein
LIARWTVSGFSEVGDAPLQIVSYNRAGLFLAVLDGKMPPPHMEPILRAFLEAGISLESGHGDWVRFNSASYDGLDRRSARSTTALFAGLLQYLS